MNKKTMRKEIIAKRDQLTFAEQQEKSLRIAEHVLALDALQDATHVFGFLNFGSEVHMQPILDALVARGKHVYVPYTEKGDPIMRIVRYTSMDDLEEGHYGILTPKEQNREWGVKENLDVILVPGVAFSQDGYRIGYGAGFYDRFIASLPQRTYNIGIGYALQHRASVPTEPHDLPVDALVSEEGVFSISERS